MLRLLAASTLLAAAGCAGGSAAPAAQEVTPGVFVPTSAPTTPSGWPDGTVLKGTVTIPAGQTITLAKGAHLTASKGAQVVVLGTLLAPAGGTFGGRDWKGITVGKGGTATLQGVSLDGAGLAAEAGAKAVSLTSGTITKASQPLNAAAGSTLTLTDVKVTSVQGVSVVKGALRATRLSYDKGSESGMVISGAASSLTLTDSHLFGNGLFESDMVITSDAGDVTIVGTEIDRVHCALHVVGVHRLTVTGSSLHDDAYGLMAYGSDPGQVHRITDTDVYDNRDFGLQESPGVTQGQVLDEWLGRRR